MTATLDFEGLPVGAFTEKLKCVKCTNLLSVFPVYINKSVGNICGRCCDTISDKTNYVFNEVFEALAHFVLFPCRYVKSGCLEKYQPPDMANHEKVCPYQTIKCPTHEFGPCIWEDALPLALHHCQDKHFDMMLKNGEFDMNLTQSHEFHNLLEYNSSLFVISRKFYTDSKLLQFSIWYLGPKNDEKNYLCEIRFKNMNRIVVAHCKTAAFHEKQVADVYLDSLKNGSDDDLTVVHCMINLGETKENENSPGEINREIVNLEFLSLLKCSACSYYALPPIYQNMSSTGKNEVKCHGCITGTTKECITGTTKECITGSTKECITGSTNIETIMNQNVSFGSFKAPHTISTGSPSNKSRPSAFVPSVPNLFRQSNTSGTSIFGATSNTSAQTPVFGQSNNSGTSIFGTTSNTSVQTPVFGQSNTSGTVTFGMINNTSATTPFSTNNTSGTQPLLGNGGNTNNYVRNTKLECLAELLTYPCKYEKNGCTYVAKPTAMKVHQEFCHYGEYNCIMAEYTTCIWLGLGKDMMTHIEEVHKDNFREMSSEICQKISTATTKKSDSAALVYCYIIKFSDKLFQVNFKDTQQHCYWSVHAIGRTGQFMYELEIIDSNKIKRLVVKQMCTSWKNKNQLFKHVNDYSALNKSQLFTFLDVNQTFKFKITILKM